MTDKKDEDVYSLLQKEPLIITDLFAELILIQSTNLLRRKDYY